MLNYYDGLKNNILEALEEKEYRKIIEEAENKDDAYDALYDRFFVDDFITGNASGSYYFSSYKARKHCYNFFRDVFVVLKECGYNKELKNFKTFVALVKAGYLNIENMTLDYAFYALEELEKLDFEKIDVITRCYYLSSVLSDVLDNYID